MGSRRRFGLFSSPAPIAVGDDGEYKTKLRTFFYMQIRGTKLESLLHKPEEYSRTPTELANSRISHTSSPSTLSSRDRSRMNTLTLIAKGFNSRIKLSRKDTPKISSSSPLQVLKRLPLSLTSSNRKITLNWTPRGTETLMAR